MARVEERFIIHAGGTVRYLVVGHGPPLLMVHGWNGSAENFETWYDDIGAVRTLVLPDLPGFGKSTPYPGRHTGETLSYALEAVAADFGARTMDVGGLCLGACVVLSLYRRRPELVDRLVLHTPLLAPDLVRGHFHHQARLLTSPPLFPVVSRLLRNRKTSDLYKRLVTEGVVDDGIGADINFQNQVRCSPRASKEWLRDGLRRHDLDLVEQRSDPTLVLVAGDDRIVKVPDLVDSVQDFPSVTLSVLADGGHAWTTDFVRRQNAVLLAFLQNQQAKVT